MKISIRRLRQVIAEAVAQELREGASPELVADLDLVLNNIQATLKALESAHQKAADPESKTIIAGVHSDVFNTAATARQYIRQLKSKPAAAPQQQAQPQQNGPATQKSPGN